MLKVTVVTTGPGDVYTCVYVFGVAAAFRFGSSDEEDIEIATNKTPERGDTEDRQEDDEFDFYT